MQMAIWRRVACWISTATRAQAKLSAFPLQQWFRKRVSVLRYTYNACLVTNIKQYKICNNNPD